MTQHAVEMNFDGLVGPTHNYAGLVHGNIASQQHKQNISHPRQAALQGLAKMKTLMDLGIPQGVLPPQLRPDIATLRRLGFSGTDEMVLKQVARDAPALLAACSSASNMWAANAATISPSADTSDGRVHITPANLVSHLHRSIETAATAALLQSIFPDDALFAHHQPLPACAPLADEGAANHMRLCADFSDPGLELFVYGKSTLPTDVPSAHYNQPRASATELRVATMPGSSVPEGRGLIAQPKDYLPPAKFSTRQTREASLAIARLHGLDPSRTMFIQQNPLAIDAGVFHNDVIAVAHRHVLLYHSAAWCAMPRLMDEICERFGRITGQQLMALEVTEDNVPLADAVRSYLFNSQLVSLPPGTMALIAPQECQEIASTKRWLEQLLQRHTPIQSIHFTNTHESMNNGGGPACLRLRVVLTPRQFLKINPNVILTPLLYDRLVVWVSRHYREQLSPSDLADPGLFDESRKAHDELYKLLKL